MIRVALGALLVVVWVLLWDRVTPGQVVAGVAVAAILLLVLRPEESRGRFQVPFRPFALVRLAAWFSWQILVSNVQVSAAVLFPRRYVRPGVVHVALRTDSPTLAALVANITALTPGMQPVGGTDEPATIDVHVLALRSEDAAIALVLRLESLVLAAFAPRASLPPTGAAPRGASMTEVSEP